MMLAAAVAALQVRIFLWLTVELASIAADVGERGGAGLPARVWGRLRCPISCYCL